MLKVHAIVTNKLRRAAMVVGGALVAVVAVVAGQNLIMRQADAATVYGQDIYYAVKKNHTGLITPWENEASGAVSKYGYTSYKKLFYASMKSGSGLTKVERLYNSRTVGFRFAATESDKQNAIANGYVVNGTGFYASTVKTAETEPVYRYTKGNYDRYALTVADRAALEADGYKVDRIVFYARPAEPIQPAKSVYDRDMFYAVVNGKGGVITAWETEASKAVDRGYDSYKKLFKASLTKSVGLSPVWRLYSSKANNFMFTASEAEQAEAVANGYAVADASTFYASTVKTAETEPVYRYIKGNRYHRYAMTAADRQQLKAEGYVEDQVVFYAKPVEDIGTPTNPVEPVEPTDPTDPRDADGKFTFAVIPDSQMEVHNNRKGEFSNRMQWLVDNRNSLDLRFVAHTGDVVNWGWLEPAQFTVASDAAKILENAKIPYAFAIGNHDARAVGHDGVAGSRKYGGSAYVNNPECVERLGKAACQTGLLQHDTREFNAVFTAERFTHVRGAYQAGKVDNIYQTFEAAGKKWMLLTLEMAPRDAVIDWANGVIAAHPDHNVLIQTHYYLTASGAISTDSGYGDGSRSATNLYNRLVKVHPNIVAVFSGHVGKGTSSRTDTGNNGNKIVSYMAGLHDVETNPVRLVEIDVKKGSLESRIYAPSKDRTIEARSTEIGLKFQ